MERSIKALLQETLWLLNMEKVRECFNTGVIFNFFLCLSVPSLFSLTPFVQISIDREEEIRQLVKVVEVQVKRVIIPHSLVSTRHVCVIVT